LSVPESLKTGGFNPLKSNSSLAAKILRESRPEVDNDFSATRRPMVFEERKIKRGEEHPQQILGAPIFFHGKSSG